MVIPTTKASTISTASTSTSSCSANASSADTGSCTTTKTSSSSSRSSSCLKRTESTSSSNTSSTTTSNSSGCSKCVRFAPLPYTINPKVMAAHRNRPTGPFLAYFEAVLLHAPARSTGVSCNHSHQALTKHLIDRLLSATMMSWLSCEKLALWLAYELSTTSSTSSSTSTISIPLPEELKRQLNTSSTCGAARNLHSIYQNTLLPQMETAVEYFKDIQTWKETFVDQMGLDLMDYYYVGALEHEDDDNNSSKSNSTMVDAYKYQALLANYSKLVDAIINLLVEQVAKESPLLFHILVFDSVETSAATSKDVKQSKIGTLLEQVRSLKEEDDGSSISVLQRIQDSNDKMKGILQEWYKSYPEVIPDVLSLGLLNQPAQPQDQPQEQDQNSLGKPGFYSHAHAYAQGLDEATTCSETTASSDDCASNNEDDDDDGEEEEEAETCAANTTTTVDSSSSNSTTRSTSGSRVVQYLKDRHPGMLLEEVADTTTSSSDDSTTCSSSSTSNNSNKTFGFQPKDHQADDVVDSITLDATHSCLAQHAATSTCTSASASMMLVVDLLATLVGETVVELK